MTVILNPERNDVAIAGHAPGHIRRWLKKIGGETPWGENRYRLVLCQHVMLHQGARWHDWDVNVPLEDQGGLEMTTAEETQVGTAGVKHSKPTRVVEEMRWIRRYPKEEGWMLQAWYPSSYYSPEHYKVTVTGRPDLPLLGEFPSKGQYERQFFYIVAGIRFETFPTMPGESWMEQAIQHHERQIAERGTIVDPESPEYKVRMAKSLAEMDAARKAYETSERDKFEARIREKIKPIFSNTLEAGRIREKWAQSARAKGVILSHCGN